MGLILAVVPPSGSYFSVIQVKDAGGWSQGSDRQMDQHIESDREKSSGVGAV